MINNLGKPMALKARKFLDISNLPSTVKNCQYAVRGQIPLRAQQITKEIESGKRYPFKKVTFCNIGNPQELGQTPITFARQVLAGVEYPDLLKSPYADKIFPSDVRNRIKSYLTSMKSGTGAYSESKGIEIVREEVSSFITRRDQLTTDSKSYSPSSNIFLSNGASQAISQVMSLHIGSAKDGIMIPIPQYPLYTATISLLGGSQAPYYLDEDDNWALTMKELKRSYSQALDEDIVPRALVVINPGNPTGSSLPKENMEEIIDFCYENKICLLADEVYQENIYNPEVKNWYSFKKVKHEMGKKYSDLPLFSFHSVSKGIFGECGKRGGYVEIDGLQQEVIDQYYKICSVNLCPNVLGQIMMGCVVNPPKEGDESYELYKSERAAIFESLKRRSQFINKTLNELDGVSCNPIDGAMYAFPKIELSQNAIKEAQSRGLQPDTFYCLELLENTGLCVIPGSGFGQKDGTYHFRTTFLPSEKDLEEVLKSFKTFHQQFVEKYK